MVITFLPATFQPILIDMDSRDYQNFKDFAEIADCWLNDETIEEYLREEEHNIQCDEFTQTDFTV